MSSSHLRATRRIISCLALLGIALCLWRLSHVLPIRAASAAQVEAARVRIDPSNPLLAKLINAVLDRTRLTVNYDSTYTRIGYPGGDVSPELGVCTDEIIRSYRMIGVDLQRAVHEDMASAFAAYPQTWNLPGPDPNIDHRRVPNLEVYFARQGASLPVTTDSADYFPGDLVTYRIEGRPHIAIVMPAPFGQRPWILHNRGFGPKLEDQLFSETIHRHFRWLPR